MPIEKTDAQQVDLFTSEIDQMIKEAISDDRLAVSKDHVWLNWRYARPDQHYTRYQLQLGSELAGYVVLKRFFDHERHDEKVHIVDLRAANPEAFRHLVRAAYGFAQGVGELNTWAFEGTSFYGALHQMGFRQTEELRHLIVYRHGLGTPVELSATRNWNFMMGDTDVF